MVVFECLVRLAMEVLELGSEFLTLVLVLEDQAVLLTELLENGLPVHDFSKVKEVNLSFDCVSEGGGESLVEFLVVVRWKVRCQGPTAVGGRNVLTEVGMGSHVRHELHIPPLKTGPFAVEGWDREVLVLVSMDEGLKHSVLRRNWDDWLGFDGDGIIRWRCRGRQLGCVVGRGIEAQVS
jgi:hypothetical protein